VTLFFHNYAFSGESRQIFSTNTNTDVTRVFSYCLWQHRLRMCLVREWIKLNIGHSILFYFMSRLDLNLGFFF